VPTSALNLDFIDFTQSYQANVGELLEIWNYWKIIIAAICHILYDLPFTDSLRIRTFYMPKTSPNIL